MSWRWSGADVAVRRQMLGLSYNAFARALGVRGQDVRAWEAGRVQVPLWVPSYVEPLLREQDELVAQMRKVLEEGLPLTVGTDVAVRDAQVAAAARAVRQCKDPRAARVIWSDAPRLPHGSDDGGAGDEEGPEGEAVGAADEH